MLEPILQGLREVDGVQGAMIVDHAASVVAHRSHAIYDLSILQQVARSVINTVDSVQLIQDDWDLLTAHFGEGKLLIRSLRTTGAKPRRYVLTVITDASLNVAFLGVALRVAAGKLLAELEAGPPTPSMTQSTPVPVPLATGSAGRMPSMPSMPDPPPQLAKTGITWSGVSGG